LEEVQALQSIYTEFQKQSETFAEEKRYDDLKQNNSHIKGKLPDHPGRTLLEQQILLLLEELHKNKSTKLSESVLYPSSPKDKAVQTYVLQKQKQQIEKTSSNSSASSSSRIRPNTADHLCNYSPRPGTARSNISNLSFISAPDRLEGFTKESLNVFAIDKIAKRIRKALTEEKKGPACRYRESTIMFRV